MEEAGDILRAYGLRSTPQRRAILAAFRGGTTEHLAAEEVFGRAASALPGLGRGTVYATLAEFTEAGLLGAFGVQEPMRYETNTDAHAHFRCRLCLRLFDVEIAAPDTGALQRHGFLVERVEARAEGVCADCLDYDAGLRAGARSMTRAGSTPRPRPDDGGASGGGDPSDASGSGDPSPAGLAAIEVDSPVGALLLAATAAGVVRVAFPEHTDSARLRALAGRGDGGDAADHLQHAAGEFERYFAGDPHAPDCRVDWSAIAGAAQLRSVVEIPYGEVRSYSALDLDVPAGEAGRIFGSNPVPIIVPCHRVTQGVELPGTYVGGPERRRWLVEHERTTAAGGE
jgi:methylated-DNA-[protein]-cysteine S-methyltransferase